MPDVFKNPETVKPIECPEVPDEYVLNYEFVEIPAEYLDPFDWQLDFAVRFDKDEDIMVLEARAIVGA
eukprot:11203377-Lingulodinium_polyedra.AAC.1